MNQPFNVSTYSPGDEEFKENLAGGIQAVETGGILLGTALSVVSGQEELVPGELGALGGGAAEETTTLYRGVNESHAFYEDAQAGIVQPNGGTATALEHNTIPGATLNSPYTSWTTDPAVAENFALRPGGNGVVIQADVPVSQITASPNLKSVLLIQNGQIVSESEVLVRGAVQGTARTVGQ